MKKEIVVAADDLESRVAILEDGELAELHVERDPRLVGSIFKAKVVSVLPGMDAAFADIGLEKNVFLCADDVGYVTETGVTSSNVPRSAPIAERLKSSQEVVVQIVRAPVAGKGARATTRLALPGRYLVLLLSDDRQIGVSRKVEDRKERDRLRKIGEEIRPPGCSMIIRTEAEGKGKQDLSADLKMLVDLQGRLMQKATHAKAPALLHQDLTLTYQVIRDAFNEEVDSLIIDAKTVHDTAVELIDDIAPHLRKRVKRYRGKLPIFYKYGVEGEIDRLLRRRVWLRAGGYISIDQAEAFTAIDVNTGRFTGTTGLADTILRTNLEAAEEIGRQLRLRDLGGIIVIDFIDMDRPRHRQKVMKAFQETLKKDRQKTNIVHLSPLGLIEMTRKRRGESLMGILTETCPVCAGLGRIRTPLTVALKIEREVRRIASADKPSAILVRTVPSVAEVMVGEGGKRSAALDKAASCPVYVRADERLTLEEFEIQPTTATKAAREITLPAKGTEVMVTQLDSGEVAADELRGGWHAGYRVMIEGVPRHPELPLAVVLTEAGHSFGAGHVLGYEPRPETAEEGRTRGRRRGGRGRKAAEVSPEPIPEPAEVSAPEEPAEAEAILVAGVEPQNAEAHAEEQARRRRPRRRRGGARHRTEPDAQAVAVEAEEPPVEAEVQAAAPAEEQPQEAHVATEATGEERKRPRRRRGGRGRRGGRREHPEGAPAEAGAAEAASPDAQPVMELPPPTPEAEAPPAAEPSAPEEARPVRAPRPRRRRSPAAAREEPAAHEEPPAPREPAPPREAPVVRQEPTPPPAPPPAPVEPAPSAPAPAEGGEAPPKRTGLLRRGSRQLGRR